MHAVLERGELFEPNRSARVHAACRNPNLGAKTKFAAIGELRRRIVYDNRRIHLPQKTLCAFMIFRDDTICVTGPKSFDMDDGFIKALDYAHGNDRIEIFGGP